jgi:hypothetical protein
MKFVFLVLLSLTAVTSYAETCTTPVEMRKAAIEALKRDGQVTNLRVGYADKTGRVFFSGSSAGQAIVGSTTVTSDCDTVNSDNSVVIPE